MNTQGFGFIALDGGRFVNPAHIVAAEFNPAEPGGVELYDEESGQHYKSRKKKACLVLTLTALEVEESERDYMSGFHLAAASRSQTVNVYGPTAEAVAAWLVSHSEPLAQPEPACCDVCGAEEGMGHLTGCVWGLPELASEPSEPSIVNPAGPVGFALNPGEKCPVCGWYYVAVGAHGDGCHWRPGADVDTNSPEAAQ